MLETTISTPPLNGALFFTKVEIFKKATIAYVGNYRTAVVKARVVAHERRVVHFQSQSICATPPPAYALAPETVVYRR